MRWKWVTAAALLAGACGNGGENSAAFCENVEEVAAIIETVDETYEGTLDDLKATTDRIEAVQADLVATAPRAIREDVGIVMTTESDTIRASEQDQLAESRRKVNAYIRAECDLTVEL